MRQIVFLKTFDKEWRKATMGLVFDCYEILIFYDYSSLLVQFSRFSCPYQDFDYKILVFHFYYLF